MITKETLDQKFKDFSKESYASETYHRAFELNQGEENHTIAYTNHREGDWTCVYIYFNVTKNTIEYHRATILPRPDKKVVVPYTDDFLIPVDVSDLRKIENQQKENN